MNIRAKIKIIINYIFFDPFNEYDIMHDIYLWRKTKGKIVFINNAYCWKET